MLAIEQEDSPNFQSTTHAPTTHRQIPETSVFISSCLLAGVPGLERCPFTAEQFYCALAAAVGRVGPSEMIFELADPVFSPPSVPRTGEFYEMVVRSLATRQRQADGLRVLDLMIDAGIPASPTCYSCAVNFASALGDEDRCLQYFSRLKDTGVLSMRSCMAPLRVLARRGDYQQCVEVLELLEKNNCVIDNIVLNVVLHACVTANRFSLAQDVFDKRRHLADVVSYNTMLKGVVSHTSYAVARSLFDEMLERGLTPTSITFNTLMNAAVREGKTAAESFKILAEMQKLNDPAIQPDKYTCSILVRGLITHRGSIQWQKEKLKMLLDIVGTLGPLDGLGLKPSFCRTILNLCAVADPDMAINACEQMVRQKAAPCEQLYQALMTAHAGQRRSECCWEAWERMLTHNVRPSKGHFLALFDASVAKDAERTKKAIELMYEAGITLQPHRVLSALRWRKI